MIFTLKVITEILVSKTKTFVLITEACGFTTEDSGYKIHCTQQIKLTENGKFVNTENSFSHVVFGI